jgi:hypothetical protein
MRDLKNKLITSGKGLTNIQSRRTKSFGYQVLGFGAGGGAANGPTPVECLVVAGGASGGGGNHYGGGGGAGGYRTATIADMALDTTFTVTVGAGGAAVADHTVGVSGSDSVFSTITSAGGGGGGCAIGLPAIAGGSGGGGGGYPYNNPGAAGNTPATTPSQGNPGGYGRYGPGDAPWNDAGGGGGGASATGDNGVKYYAGDGGAGSSSDITGSPVSYAGGGGGAGHEGMSDCGTGGVGGGGPGSYSLGVSGTVNTGGGGGGAERNAPATSGAGGSGIVILKIPATHSATFSGGVTSSLNTGVPDYKVYSITATSDTSQTVTFS